MKKYITLCVLLTISFALYPNNNKTDSLLSVLDATIEDHKFYQKKKETRINNIKLELNSTKNIDERYHLSQSLFKEYRNYNMDSALHVATIRLDLANKLNNDQYIQMANMNIAEILGIMGLYKESLDIMSQIDHNPLTSEELKYYYHVNHSLYYLMYQNLFPNVEQSRYKELLESYKDSLLQVNTPNTLPYELILSGKLEQNGQLDEALKLMENIYLEHKNDSLQIGTIAYGLSEIYRKKGDLKNSKEYLIISAIGDQQKASRSYISLRKLAILLYDEGDIDRAYVYMKRSMEDAISAKARFRMLEISQDLPIIIAAYDKKTHEERNNLISSLILIITLVVVLVVSLIYIYKQLKKLSRVRKAIDKMYNDMKKMNVELKELNDKLAESNQIKEEYIGFIFNLCSSYINKIENYRIEINRKLKANMHKDALRFTECTLATEEVKEFYRIFDSVFLNLYPNFIRDFNAMLLDTEQVNPKSGDILTSELRIFALMRLGITDSSKIASFLHYSSQTVYNYKLKTHNKLKVSKEEFSSRVQEIGK